MKLTFLTLCCKPFCLFIAIQLVVSNNIYAETHTMVERKVYSVDFGLEAPLTVGGFLVSFYGIHRIKDKDPLDIAAINNLNADDVWAIDRVALRQNSSYRFDADKLSDWGLYTSILLPGLLALDKEIKNDWLNILLLYVEAQAATNISYAWGPSQWTKRKRPYLYYDDIPMSEKLDSGTTDSFFSGHNATVATASFFTAKVYCDYHPELGAKKWLIYGAALIPPTFVGIMRVKALKHFPTDVMLGGMVGAAIGILIPELHKINKKKDIEIIPMAGSITGLRLAYRFKYK